MANQCNNESKWKFKSPFHYEELRFVLEHLGIEIFNAEYNDISTDMDDQSNEFWLELSFGSDWRIPTKQLQEMADYFDADIKCVGWEYGDNYFGCEEFISNAANKFNIGKILKERQQQFIESVMDSINVEEGPAIKYVDPIFIPHEDNNVDLAIIASASSIGKSQPLFFPPAPGLNWPRPGVPTSPEEMAEIIKEVNARPMVFEVIDEIPPIETGTGKIIDFDNWPNTAKAKAVVKANGDEELIKERIAHLKKQLSKYKALPKVSRGTQVTDTQAIINRLQEWIK